MFEQLSKVGLALPGRVVDGVVCHVVVGVVADHVPLRHHPDQGLLVPSHGSGVVKVQVVRVDEEGGSHANLGVECDLLSQETHNNTKVVIFIKERVARWSNS